MRKSYIVLSLILSQALCADTATTDTNLTANFGSTTNGSNGNPSKVTKPNGTEAPIDASNGDWSGGTSYLNVSTSDLTFAFSANKETSLTINNNFSFQNKIPQSNGSVPQANITITRTNNSGGVGAGIIGGAGVGTLDESSNTLNTLIFGSSTSTSYGDKISIGSNINLLVMGFSSVEVKSNLSIASSSTFDISSVTNITNNGGIVLEGDKSTLKVNSTLTNNGTILMRNGSKIQSVSNLSIGTNPPATSQGSIIVQGSAEISSGDQDLTITNQNITIQNLASKNKTDSSKTDFSQATLTLSTTKSTSGSLTLGDSDKAVNIIGELSKTDKTITNLEGTSEVGELKLSGFTSIQAKNVSFKNVVLSSTTANSMTLDSGTLGLENTTMSLGSSSLSITAKTASAITLTGQNSITTTGALTIIGTHKLSGDGVLDFMGSSVKLGDGSNNLNLVGTGSTIVGVKATSSSSATIETNKLNLSGTHLQVFGGSTIKNTQIVLNNSGIYGIDSEGNASDLSFVGKDSGSGGLIVKGGTSATISGSNISFQDQVITLQNTSSPTTLTLQAERGSITFGSASSGMSKIDGKNTSVSDNLLYLYTPLVQVQAQTDIKQVSIHTDRDISFEISEGANLKLLSGTEIDTSGKIGEQTTYHTLSFTSSGNQSQITLNQDTKLSASTFLFQNQKVSLSSSGAGVKFNLYSYDSGELSSLDNPSTSGSFHFSNTTFSDGTSSTLNLFSGTGGSNLFANGMTLVNVSLSSCTISGTTTTSSTCSTSSTQPAQTAPKNKLYAHQGSLTALGKVTIEASAIYGGESSEAQGVGVDINVGNSTKYGSLTIKSDTDSDTFTLGGTLTIDNSRSGGADSSFDIQLGTTTKKLSDQSLSLQVNGGLKAIGESEKQSTTELKAKDFTFGEDAVVTSSSGIFRLNMNGSDNTVTLGKLLDLQGIDSSSVTTKFLVKNSQGAYGVTLNLHDVLATGNASVDSNQLGFKDSNISVSNSGTNGSMTFQDRATTTDSLISGTIASITLDSGKLEFKDKYGSNASITLNASSTITSSGDSSLTLKTIQVGKDSSNNDGLYSLNVSSGTFTLKESTAGNQLGAITLGSESSQGGEGGSFIYKNGDPSNYNAITLKGNITSYGNSSIQANSFTISAKEDKSKYSISSNGGELKLIAQGSSALSATADISLNSGSLGYYGSNGTLSSLSLDSSSSLSATGDSTLQANGLNLNGASVSASGGTLTLKGINSSTKAGNVSVGNGGVLKLEKNNTTLASLSVSEGSKLTLSANVPYITSDEPLGGGVFGQVIAQSVQFESKSGGLVQISLKTSSASSSSYDDSLFALREGAITLISTENGIQKKSGNASYTNITLNDIVTDTSGLTSITLTPYLDMATNTQGQSIVKNLLLNLSVSQTNVTQLVESIKDSSAKETMTSIINSGNNASILESILQSDNNAFKVGMAEYISSGNTAVVQTSLEYINGAMSSLEDSMFASNKIYELIAMLRTSNVENRMVRGKNPFMAKTRLSSLIRSISGTRYASNDDSLLLEEEESGINYGELWANFDGAMSFSQEEKGNSSLYGMSAGYDTLLGEQRNYLLGFFASYGYGAYSFNYARNNSHNFGLGLYTRMSFENSEVDIILSQNIGLNHTEIDLGATNSYVAQALKQTLGYNFYTTDIEARYGYVFKVGNEDSPYYFRPFGGINFALIINSSARGDGEAELGIQAMNTYQLSVNVGVEMRKYFGEENYFYLLPILQKGLLNDGAGAKVGFYGAENLQLTPAYNVDTSLSLLLGGVGNVGENVAVSGGVGVKYGFEKKDILTNWNVGIRYKF